MSVDNPLWGAPRIHGELRKLGFEVAQSSVAKYMVKRYGPPSPGWSSFLRNHAPDIAAMDLFIAPTIGFDLLYVLVIIRLERRRLVWINVTRHPTAEWIARQVTEAFPWDETPRYLIRDRDRVYGAAVIHRLRAIGIRDKPIAPGSPWQNGFAERLIGSIRRECVDHIVVLGETHLRRILTKYATYYNELRNSSVSRQRRSDSSPHPARRPHHIWAGPRRTSSPLLSNPIFGTDMGRPEPTRTHPLEISLVHFLLGPGLVRPGSGLLHRCLRWAHRRKARSVAPRGGPAAFLSSWLRPVSPHLAYSARQSSAGSQNIGCGEHATVAGPTPRAGRAHSIARQLKRPVVLRPQPD